MNNEFGLPAYRDASGFRVRPQPWTSADKVGGSSGAGGAQGFQGKSGFQGFQGAQGADGVGGFSGNNGADGAASTTPGAQGAQGPDGGVGADGHKGPDGKDAILHSNYLNEIVKVTCVEMPETLLMDVVDVSASGAEIDPTFLSLIEDGSLIHIGTGGRFLKSDNSHLLVTETPGSYIVAGTRKGFAGRRFVPQTQEQMNRSNKFWRRQRA